MTGIQHDNDGNTLFWINQRFLKIPGFHADKQCMEVDFHSEDFLEYIKKDTSRADFIQNWLKERGIDSHRTIIEGKSHILVQFDSQFYNPQFKIKTVIAHYDRVEGSPGANDNSSSDWLLMNWAVELSAMRSFHNVRIYFTDGEELGWNTGVSEQGAYGIASVFKRLGITSDDVYVFDCCGRGEVPILSRTTIPEKAPKHFIEDFNDLYERTQDLLRRSCPGRWMTLPVPYSDNASFLACGIPAVALTMLPADEASSYARELLRNKELEDAVLNRESSKKKRIETSSPEYGYKSRLPATWRLFHTENDNAGSLTDVSCRIMSNILRTLAEMKTPLR